LIELKRTEELEAFLLNWRAFSLLYNNEHNDILLKYWRQVYFLTKHSCYFVFCILHLKQRHYWYYSAWTIEWLLQVWWRTICNFF